MQNAWNWWKIAFLSSGDRKKPFLGKLGVQEQTGHFSRQLSSQLCHNLNSCKQFPPLLHSFLLTASLFSPSFPSFLFLSFSLLCFFFFLQCSYPDNFKISWLSSLNTMPKSAIRACLTFCLWKTIFCCNVGYNLWMKWVSVPFLTYGMMSKACSGHQVFRREVACLFLALLWLLACVWDTKKSNKEQSFR